MNPESNPLKKAAKSLLREVQAANSTACKRVREVYSDTHEWTDEQVAEYITLGRCQHVVAVGHEFKNWDEVSKASPTLIRLAITMQREPFLNDNGIDFSFEDRKIPLEERRLGRREMRKTLRNSVDQVERTMAWLQENIPPIKTINRKHSSYGLKHIAEKEIGYITNGVFIAAALILGYTPRFLNSPNVQFAMSEKAIKQAFDRVNR